MKNENLWTRRQFSKAALSAQVLLGVGLWNIPLACSGPESPAEPLDAAAQRILSLCMEEIIPANQTMPSAAQSGGVAYVVGVLKDYPHLTAPFRQILEEVEKLANDIGAQGFVDLTSQQRVRVLQQYEKTRTNEFQVLQNFVYESYYTNQAVWELIGYEPYPTMGAGPQMEPFDPSTLQRVKELPSFYLEIDGHGQGKS